MDKTTMTLGLVAMSAGLIGMCCSADELPPLPLTPEVIAAQATVAKLTRAEKYKLLNGVGADPTLNPYPGYYVGNTEGLPEHGIPSIRMQDAAQGWRTNDERMIGEVTAWPCSLAVSSTWDEALMETWGQALAVEHKRKGANVLLGPSVNVHRVALGGRNAEYLSGESPHLGAVMAARYVEGVQKEGVAAVVKHFALNNQETNRNFVNAIADARTMWEVYYPPFEAAIAANVAFFMCSYNVVNGVHGCGNKDTLDRDLKTLMNFTGAVMTDWGAVHENGVMNSGVDIDMPGNDGYFNENNLSSVSGARLDQMATRVVASLLKVHAAESCDPPLGCNKLLYDTMATDASHHALARKIGGESVILLQNANNALPLKSGETIALVGSECDAENNIEELMQLWTNGNAYVMGGSGRVIPKAPVSIISGLRATGLYTLVTSLSNDVPAALKAMKSASKVIICGSATSSESFDRDSLAVDQDDFIANILRASQKIDISTIVVLMTPGSFTAQWAPMADAVVNQFLGGESAGHAIADVLSGKLSPSGKLPVTVPKKESDMVAPCPENQIDCPYSESLNVGWRGLVDSDVEFPFGHGLSYTSFDFSWIKKPHSCRSASGEDAVCLSGTIANTGTVAGAEVVQLYVAFPEPAKQPPLLLKGFTKTKVLAAGERQVVTFTLPRSSKLASWKPHVAGATTGKFVATSGLFQFHVGSSSRVIYAKAGLMLK